MWPAHHTPPHPTTPTTPIPDAPPPTIHQIVSNTFYFSKLKTSEATRKQRTHPIPASFVNVTNGRSEFNEGSCFNREEAREVVHIASHAVKYLGFDPSRINILSFYNAQRDLLEKSMQKEKLKAVSVVSVDAMQGREADLIILSCVRADVTVGADPLLSRLLSPSFSPPPPSPTAHG